MRVVERTCVLLLLLLGPVTDEQLALPLRLFDGAAVLYIWVHGHTLSFIFHGLFLLAGKK